MFVLLIFLSLKPQPAILSQAGCCYQVPKSRVVQQNPRRFFLPIPSWFSIFAASKTEETAGAESVSPVGGISDESAYSLQRLFLPFPLPQPTIVSTIYQTWVTDVLPLFISHLVTAHDCLSTLIAYFIDFFSQEARNYTCWTVILCLWPWANALFYILPWDLSPPWWLWCPSYSWPSFHCLQDLWFVHTSWYSPSLLKEKYMFVLYRLLWAQ